MLKSCALLVPMMLPVAPALAQPLDVQFRDGVAGWRVVLDGVMGGLSSGRVGQSETGTLLFRGDLSLENNGGFSQIRSSVPEGSLDGADGIELRVKGDGRQYTFDIRCADVRLMAGSFQSPFETKPGEWRTVRLPFSEFRLYNFGRPVPNPPPLVRSQIESIGVTLADKKSGPFTLEIESIRSFGGRTERPDGSAAADDLASVADRAGLTTLLSLVKAAQLDLPDPRVQRITVFAPTNEAFSQLPAEQVEALLQPENRRLLRTILAYHIATPSLPAAELLSRRTVTTLTGQQCPIDSSSSVLLVGEARLLATDVPFNGGVVHVIDRVLMPETRSIDEVVAGDERLSLLTAALQQSGLAEQLGASNEGPWTLFAPTDEAFESLPDGVLDELLAPQGRSALIAVLAGHVVPGRLFRGELPGAKSARSLSSSTIDLAVRDGRISASGAQIVQADLQAANGVIHLIDRVLLPETPTAAREERSSSAVIEVLEAAVSRGAPLFNEGNVEACDAIYQIAVLAVVALAPERFDPELRVMLEQALAEARSEPHPQSRAWIYRRAIDRVYERLSVLEAGRLSRAQ